MAMSWHAFCDDPPLGKFDGCKQSRRSVSFVVVCERLQSPRIHRETLLRAIKSLNLTFLIARQNEGALWRIEIQTNDVSQLVNELRVVGNLEGLGAVRF